MPLLYRSFRNPDPPGLVKVWNDSLTGRGAAFVQGTTPLEHYVLAKPYFDRAGLIVAEEDGTLAGFVHAGFGPDANGQRLSTELGAICALAVKPSHRRRGIGTELLHRAEQYLRGKGARTIHFGAMPPANPFYLGLYGGSESPGVLASDAGAEGFLLHHHYVLADRVAVLDRNLESVPGLADPRFGALKRKYELRILPRPVSQRWFDEAILSPLEMLEFQLQETATGQSAAFARVWDMDLFGWRWHQPSAGLIDVTVREDRRRQGLGKFLLVQILRYLQDQFYTLLEVQTMEGNVPALNLYQTLGFKKVDEGRLYRLQNDAP